MKSGPGKYSRDCTAHPAHSLEMFNHRIVNRALHIPHKARAAVTYAGRGTSSSWCDPAAPRPSIKQGACADALLGASALAPRRTSAVRESGIPELLIFARKLYGCMRRRDASAIGQRSMPNFEDRANPDVRSA